jgi:hypothetical protein
MTPRPSCYTCNHFEDKQWGMCCNLNSDDYGLSQFMVGFIERVGCASHSNAGSEAVLDEFLKWLPEYLKENMMCGAKRTRMEIEEKIRELRQQTKCEEVRRNLEQVKAKPSKERDP